MKLVAMIVTIRVITDGRLIAQTKRAALLLTDGDTLGKFGRAITSRKFVRIGIRLDGRTELFRGQKVEILDVISIKRGSLRTRRAFRNSGQAIPSHALAINTFRRNVENALLNTGFVKTLAGLVPNKFSHSSNSSLKI